MNKPEILEYCEICDKEYPTIKHNSHVNSKNHKKKLSEIDYMMQQIKEEHKSFILELNKIKNIN
jgi:hypothetical protein